MEQVPFPCRGRLLSFLGVVFCKQQQDSIGFSAAVLRDDEERGACVRRCGHERA